MFIYSNCLHHISNPSCEWIIHNKQKWGKRSDLKRHINPTINRPSDQNGVLCYESF